MVSLNVLPDPAKLAQSAADFICGRVQQNPELKVLVATGLTSQGQGHETSFAQIVASDLCIGCGYCVTGCPFDVPRISKKDHKAYKCTLCSDRVYHALEQACGKSCPTGSIQFGTKEQMLDYGAHRVEKLKERGFENAGIYDPAGVGGTHVMYVLHHADKPEIYHGLPKDPTISPIVNLWKGLTKYAGMFAMGAFAAVGVLHYLVMGPNQVTSEDEQNAKRLAGGGS